MSVVVSQPLPTAVSEGVGACRSCGRLFAGGSCPDCGGGERLVDADRRTTLSKFLSGLLRHFPDEHGVALDGRGWAPLDDVVAAARAEKSADREAVLAVLGVGRRFERRESRVRATYGHSVDVDLDGCDGDVPDTLYHGTAPRTAGAIEAEGLRPMGRQAVHLSPDPETARAVGRRHTDREPVVFAVDAAAMLADGRRVDRRGPETFTADRVPPAYLDRR